MSGKGLAFFLMVFLSIPLLSWAGDKRWQDEAEFSLVDTGGNTEIFSLAARNTLNYNFTEKLKGTWTLDALYGEEDGDKTAESYATQVRLDYDFTKRVYGFGLIGWMKNEFSGLESKYYIGPGAGYKFLTGPRQFLSGEAGLNYYQEKFTDQTDEDYLGGRLFGLYKYALTGKNTFSQSVEFLNDFSNEKNYMINTETALIFVLSESLSLKTSYVIAYDNDPALDGVKNTDTTLKVTFIVALK